MYDWSGTSFQGALAKSRGARVCDPQRFERMKTVEISYDLVGKNAAAAHRAAVRDLGNAPFRCAANFSMHSR